MQAPLSGIPLPEAVRCICGIDPNTYATGISIWRDGVLRWSGLCLPKDKKANNIRRSGEILDQLAELWDYWHVNAVACERMSHVDGSAPELDALIAGIKGLAKSCKLVYWQIAPGKWRPLIAGLPGSAKKEDVLGMLRLRYADLPDLPHMTGDELEGIAIGEAAAVMLRTDQLLIPSSYKRSRIRRLEPRALHPH